MSVNKNVNVIGLTGMSGAGKSTACAVFKQSGFEIIDCDKICREIVEKGKPCLLEITDFFGNGIIDGKGELNRPLLGKIIFSDKSKRLSLNGIMYPYVSYIVIKRILTEKNKYVILDAPTLFESGIDDICDKTVSVTAGEAVLIDRIIKRDNIDRIQAKNRLLSQNNAEFFKKRSDYVIENNGSAEELASEVLRVIDNIRNDT